VRVFVFEFITGGGSFDAELRPVPENLLREGAAMAGALVSDLAAVDGVRVSTLVDHRLPATHLPSECDLSRVRSADEVEDVFRDRAGRADWSVVIAPEFDGHLLKWCRFVIDAGGRLLGPSIDAIELASDKHRTAERLRANGVRAPNGVVLVANQPLAESIEFPAVLKPIDGAGSQDVQLVRSGEQAVTRRGDMRLEEFQQGAPASIAFLCGPRDIVPLLPCRQHLSDDGRFTYLGGSLPLPPALADRATRLGLAAVRTLPSPLGYVGVDLVLGDDPNGADDVVIEINPRLTTSYVGLRAASRTNLAAGMIAVAQGVRWNSSWTRDSITFDADGTITSQRGP
jgi:predicted ATP-grasp superfamily ATP-dependent carboligase